MGRPQIPPGPAILMAPQIVIMMRMVNMKMVNKRMTMLTMRMLTMKITAIVML